jgi:hypothetical protein
MKIDNVLNTNSHHVPHKRRELIGRLCKVLFTNLFVCIVTSHIAHIEIFKLMLHKKSWTWDLYFFGPCMHTFTNHLSLMTVSSVRLLLLTSFIIFS